MFWPCFLGGEDADDVTLMTTEIFDGESSTFRRGPLLPFHSSHSCFLRLNTTHFIQAGGFFMNYTTGLLESSKQVHTFNTETMEWTRHEDMNSTKVQHACGLAGITIQGLVNYPLG
jgi:hypothetical protein